MQQLLYRNKLIIVALFCVWAGKSFAQTSNALPQLGKSPMQEVINALTLDEKLDIIRGAGMKYTPPDAQGTVAGNIDGKVPGAAGSTHAVPRLGIPSIILADGPAGLRIDTARSNDPKRYYATAFPIATALASSWNIDLVKQVGQAMGNEVLEYGVDVLLAPGMDMQRNPLGGRNFEYYSEDPLLTGKMASSMVRGVQSNGVGTSIKHFAVNDQESNRNNVNAIVSERALREIYLKPFKIAVKEANPWTIMSAYNKVNGTYCSESEDLLTTILRQDWNFEGLVMTDWFAGRDFVAQVKAGNDLLMPGRTMEARRIKRAIESGNLPMELLDRNVEKILNVILKSPSFKNYKISNNPDLENHAKIARNAGAEGIVLLKNDNNCLPIKTNKIALLGNTSYDLIIGGSGSGEVYKSYSVSLNEGLTDAGYKVDNQLASEYISYIQKEKEARPPRHSILDVVKPTSEMPLDNNTLEQLVNTNDIAIITIGRNAGENSDRDIETDYYLNSQELELIKKASQIFHAKGKQIVVILNVDAVTDVAKWRNWVDGILLVWQPGQEAGHSIADVITGKINPSGHLTSTFPLAYADVPSADCFPGEPAERPETTIYNEDIFVGYRYYCSKNIPVAYEFGYGLSYTQFSYSNLKLSSLKFKDEIDIEVTISNTGNVAGKEVVQLYLSAPQLKLDKPVEELKAFAKTELLEPGASQTLQFTLDAKSLASFYTVQSSWIAEAGEYTVKIGASSSDFKLSKSFSVKNDIIVEKVNKVLTPQIEIREIIK